MVKTLLFIAGLAVLVLGSVCFAMSVNTLSTGARGDFFISNIEHQNLLMEASYGLGILFGLLAIIRLENKWLESLMCVLFVAAVGGMYLVLMQSLPPNLQFHPEGGLSNEDRLVLMNLLGYAPAFGIAGGFAFTITNIMNAHKNTSPKGEDH